MKGLTFLPHYRSLTHSLKPPPDDWPWWCPAGRPAVSCDLWPVAPARSTASGGPEQPAGGRGRGTGWRGTSLRSDQESAGLLREPEPTAAGLFCWVEANCFPDVQGDERISSSNWSQFRLRGDGLCFLPPPRCSSRILSLEQRQKTHHKVSRSLSRLHFGHN